jgi:RNA polymerase sigma-70 factor, ECF subfamily
MRPPPEPPGPKARITGRMAASDARLVERIPHDRSGEELRELYRRYAGELFGFACNALGDRELAEEIVQDVFARLWRHAEDYDPSKASVRTWLYAIARNRIVDARRRASVRPGLAPAKEEKPSEELDRELEQAVLRWQVAAALSRLSPEHREVIRLAHWSGLSLREIAERKGIPLGTAKSRAYYALQTLRLILDEMEVER